MGDGMKVIEANGKGEVTKGETIQHKMLCMHCILDNHLHMAFVDTAFTRVVALAPAATS